MIKQIEDTQDDGPFIGDEWWLSYEKTERGDDGPYRQFQMYSKEYGCLGLSPWLDCLDETMFQQMMLIRAAPKLLTVLNWVADNFPNIPHHTCIKNLVKEAQWTQDEWYEKASELR